MTASRDNRPKVEPFEDWKNRRKFLVSCKRHHWYVEVFLEQNAKDLLLAHNVVHHGHTITLSTWAQGMKLSGRL